MKIRYSESNFGAKIFLGVLFFCLLSVTAAFAQDVAPDFKKPEAGPAVFNVNSLLHIGKGRQFKSGGLSVGSNLKSGDTAIYVSRGRFGIGLLNPKFALDVLGQVNAPTVCINGDCRNGWPKAPITEGPVPVYQCPVVNSGQTCGGNICSGQLTTENSCRSVISVAGSGCAEFVQNCQRNGSLEPYDKNYSGPAKEDLDHGEGSVSDKDVGINFQVNGKEVSPTITGQNPSFTVPYGTAATFTWTSSNAIYCFSKGDLQSWNRSLQVQGSWVTEPLTFNPIEPKIVTVSCVNLFGDVNSRSATIRTNLPPLNVELKLNGQDQFKDKYNPPVKIKTGTNVIFSWVSSGAARCESKGDLSGWSGSQPLNGSFNAGKIEDLDLRPSQPRNFNIICTDPFRRSIMETAVPELEPYNEQVPPVVFGITKPLNGARIKGTKTDLNWYHTRDDGDIDVTIELWESKSKSWAVRQDTVLSDYRVSPTWDIGSIGNADTCDSKLPSPHTRVESVTSNEIGWRVVSTGGLAPYTCPSVPSASSDRLYCFNVHDIKTRIVKSGRTIVVCQNGSVLRIPYGTSLSPEQKKTCLARLSGPEYRAEGFEYRDEEIFCNYYPTGYEEAKRLGTIFKGRLKERSGQLSVPFALSSNNYYIIKSECTVPGRLCLGGSTSFRVGE